MDSRLRGNDTRQAKRKFAYAAELIPERVPSHALPRTSIHALRSDADLGISEVPRFPSAIIFF